MTTAAQSNAILGWILLVLAALVLVVEVVALAQDWPGVIILLLVFVGIVFAVCGVLLTALSGRSR